MSEIEKRLKLNKFSLFITLSIALFAAFSTMFFAVMEGIKSNVTILFRVCVSFSFFAVIGYFVSSFVEKEYLTNFENDVDVKTEPVKTEEPKPASVEQDLDGQKDNNTKENNNDNMLTNDDSFDKIVVVDNNDDE